MADPVVIYEQAIARYDHQNYMWLKISYTYERQGNEMVYTPRFEATKLSAYVWGWVSGATLSFTISGVVSSKTWDSIGQGGASAVLTPIRVRARDVAGIPGCVASAVNGASNITQSFTAVVTDPGAPDIRVMTENGFINLDEVQIGGVVPDAAKVMNDNNEWVEV